MNARRRITALFLMTATAVTLANTGVADAHTANSSQCVVPQYQLLVDSLPRLVVSDNTAIPIEYDDTLEFKISLSKAPTSDVTVHYCTRNRTALAGTHYSATSGEVIFRGPRWTLSGYQPGETVKVVRVKVLPRPASDGTRTMELVVPQATGTVIKDGVGLGTIHYFT